MTPRSAKLALIADRLTDSKPLTLTIVTTDNGIVTVPILARIGPFVIHKPTDHSDINDQPTWAYHYPRHCWIVAHELSSKIACATRTFAAAVQIATDMSTGDLVDWSFTDDSEMNDNTRKHARDLIKHYGNVIVERHCRR